MSGETFFDPGVDRVLERAVEETRRLCANYTDNQLFRVWCVQHYQSPGSRWVIGLAFIALVPFLMYAGVGVLWAAIPMGLGGVLIQSTMGDRTSRKAFDAALLGRMATDRAIPGLLRMPQLTESRAELEPDLYQHNVDRVLVVDSDLLVDFLVNNGFAAKNRVLIVSENGYPAHLAEIANRSMGQPSCLVSLLEGLGCHDKPMLNRIRSQRALRIPLRVVSVGLFAANLSQVRAWLYQVPAGDCVRVPVDMLPYEAFAGVLAECVREHISLSEFYQRQATKARHTTYDFG
jgi:hypothetical protein